MSDWLDDRACWFDDDPQPAPRRPPPPPAPPGPRILACPACAATDLRVRSSAGSTSYLLCNACACAWSITGRPQRVLVLGPVVI